ncbi:MAG TPA: Ig-like domain repeat protein [Candidatus Acidoferrales bacterium]|nr:Ig-like domain repeat protein [Candidatus Acidoferrales bacterium]
MRISAILPRKNWRRAALVVLLLCSPLAAFGQGISGPLVTQAVDETKLARLAGNTHPLALPQFDRGPAPLDLPMQRMLLILKRSPAQEATLESLLEDQQYKLSTNFHKWLTPDEFGQQFGPSDQDIQTVTSWLASHGFQVARISRGRNVVEFSGTAAQVQDAFHTTIHSYLVNGEQHWANNSDPQIPAALAPAVAGVDSLNNFAKKAAYHTAKMVTKQEGPSSLQATNPALTFPCGSNNGATVYCNAITPYDFATIYNVLPLWNATSPIDGTGQTIAIVARSNINLQDVSSYRSFFGLPTNTPQVILDGPDPGLVRGDETEADLDVEMSGAVAKGATIKLVVSQSTETTDGVDLSALYIVDNNVAPVMSTSFGLCELFLGTAGNLFYNNLWEQAAAEGISIFVSTGDQGSAGCDFFQGTPPQPARNGLQVSGLASTPYNVAVGGTDFNDFFNQAAYWNTISNNPTTQESAKGYIPEMTWNDTCTNSTFLASLGFSSNAETDCNDPRLSGGVAAVGGSGGKSGCTTPSGSFPSGCAGGYAKPPWQTGTGVPNDTKRDLPDVSLFAGSIAGTDFYAICEADAIGTCTATNFVGIGGTSASSPAFAGLMALVDQKTGTRQGNPNFVLYKLAAKQSGSSCNSSTGPASTCVFNDVTSGTIAMPCATGSLNCNTSNGRDQFGVLSGYNTGAGYDLATGLGSVNAANMVNNWNTVTFTPSATTLTLNGGSAVNITHGSPVNVAVSVSPTSPRPTGDVPLIATQGANTFGFDTMTLSGGAASGMTNMLPGGTSYTVKAHYEGDGTYGGSDSNAVNVTVTPEASKTNLHVVMFNPTTGQITNPNATTFPYGSSYLLRADVTNGSGANCFNSSSSSLTYACPTGTVSMTDNGGALGSGAFGLNSQGYTEDRVPFQSPTAQFGGGTHSLAGNYSGDNSYTASSTTDSLTVTPAPTTTSTAFNPPLTTVVIGSQFGIFALTKSQSIGAAPSGTYTAFDGTTQLSGSGSFFGFSGSPGQPASCQEDLSISVSAPSGPHTLTVKYSGDTNYTASTSTAVTVNALYGDTMTASATPNNVIFGSNTPVTVTATVNTSNPATNASLKPTGTVTFLGFSNPVTTTVGQDSKGNWVIQATATTTSTPTQSLSVQANYSGDSNYTASGASVFVNVTIPDFSISASSTPLAITAGQTGTTTITVTPTTSFTSTVALGCGNGSSIPGATCSISPSSVTLSNSTPATAMLTISTLAPSSGTSAVTIPVRLHASGMMLPPGREIWWTLSFLAGFAALLLVASPFRRRTLHPALGLALVCLLSFAIGCGGTSASPPPIPTTTVISVPSTKVAQSAGLALTATVTSTKPVTGLVIFTASNCGFSTGGTILNDVAQATANFLPVGTCSLAAQYGGDAKNQPSQSGNLNIAVTGVTSQQIFGQTGPLGHLIPVSVTIQ